MSIELGPLIVAQPDCTEEVGHLLRLVRGMLPSASVGTRRPRRDPSPAAARR